MAGPRYDGPERRAPDNSGVWKWLAGILGAMIISSAVTHRVTNSNAPWVSDSATVMLRIRTLERQFQQVVPQIQRIDTRQEVILERIDALLRQP